VVTIAHVAPSPPDMAAPPADLGGSGVDAGVAPAPGADMSGSGAMPAADMSSAGSVRSGHSGGCSIGGASTSSSGLLLLLCALGLLLRRRQLS
jgi:MYXO-CTERM domain-containing protein